MHRPGVYRGVMTPTPAIAAAPEVARLEVEIAAGAFTALLQAAEPAHRVLAARMLGNAEAANDALQEAWLRAWNQRSSLRTADAVHGWLRQIVARECLRALRRRALLRWLPFLEPVDPRPGPESSAANTLDWRRARAIVERLPPQQRLVWGLRFDEGWTVAEIAHATSLSPETVKTHLSRALLLVQRRMGASEVNHGL